MDGFQHITTLDIRFRDLDSLGHVNNATILTYAETARFRYLVEVGLVDIAKAHDQQFGFILAHIQCDFKKPIMVDQSLRIGSRVRGVKRSSFRVEYRIEADDELVAEGYGVMVHFDYKTNRSLPLTEAMRAKIEAFEANSSA